MKKPGIGDTLVRRFLPSVIRRSYALKLAAIFVLLGLTLGTMGLVATYAITENVQDSSNTQFAETASQESRQIESWLQNYYNIANIIAEDTVLDTGDEEQISQSFRSRTLQFPSILAIHYVDTSDERIVASTNADLENESLTSRSAPWTADLNFDGQRHVSSPYTSRNVTRLAITQRVDRGADRVVVLELETRVAAPVLGSTQANLDTGYTEIVTGTGQVVFSERPSRIGTTYRNQTGSQVLDTASSAGVAGTTLTDENPYIRDELGSNRYLVGYAQVEGTDWVVVKHARRDAVYGFAQSVFFAGIVATGVIVVLTGLLGVFVGQRTSADIDHLVNLANEMEQGNLTVDFTTDRIDNIGRLYSEFDRTQQALREQIEQSKLVEHSYDLITVTGPEGIIRYQSPSVSHIIGLEPDEIEGQNIFTATHDEDTDTVRSAIQRVVENPQNEQRFEFRIQNATGEWRYFEAVCENHLDDPFVDGLILSSRDITERRAREEELREREQAIERAREQLRQIIDLVPDPVFVKNLDDEVLLSNEANAELHGMTPEEIEGKREVDIEPEVENIDNFDKYRQREIEVIETGKPMTFEEELLDPDGETRIFKMTRIPFKTTGTDEDAVLCYARDVTDLKEYEQELEETKRTLEKSNEKLEQFAGVVSHDLRNPLNAAQLRLDLLRGEEADEHVTKVGQNLDRMEEMINDLLTLSRAGATVKDPEDVLLADVVTESWETAQTDDADFEVTVTESTTVRADRDRLRHIFENLFRNAVDHNDLPLTVRVGLLEADDDQHAGFFIEDDGDGIPPDERNEVFDHGHTTNDDGTGFGLSIVEDVVDAHDWDISITESSDGGARFEIRDVDIDT